MSNMRIDTKHIPQTHTVRLARMAEEIIDELHRRGDFSVRIDGRSIEVFEVTAYCRGIGKEGPSDLHLDINPPDRDDD